MNNQISIHKANARVHNVILQANPSIKTIIYLEKK